MIYNENHVLRTTLIFTVIFGFATMFWRIQVGLGLLLGGFIGVLTFRLLIISSTKLLRDSGQREVSHKEATKQNWSSFLKRCVLYGVTLVIAIVSPYLSFLGTFAGLLLPRVAIYYHQIQGRTKGGT